MANTKGFSIRQKVIDRCLQSSRGYSIKEIMDKCNYELEDRGLHVVTAMNTIRDDIMEIQNTYHIDVETIRIGRNKRYRYEERDFSIYKAPLSEKDMANLEEILSNLGAYQGRSQFEWIEEVTMRIQSTLSCHRHRKKTIVEFDDNPNLRGREHFQSLFDAIEQEHSLEIDYKSFNAKESKTLIINPYYLKQYTPVRDKKSHIKVGILANILYLYR